MTKRIRRSTSLLRSGVALHGVHTAVRTPPQRAGQPDISLLALVRGLEVKVLSQPDGPLALASLPPLALGRRLLRLVLGLRLGTGGATPAAAGGSPAQCRLGHVPQPHGAVVGGRRGERPLRVDGERLDRVRVPPDLAEHPRRVERRRAEDAVGGGEEERVLTQRRQRLDGLARAEHRRGEPIGKVAKVSPREDAQDARVGSSEELLPSLERRQAEQLLLQLIRARLEPPFPQVVHGEVAVRRAARELQARQLEMEIVHHVRVLVKAHHRPPLPHVPHAHRALVVPRADAVRPQWRADVDRRNVRRAELPHRPVRLEIPPLHTPVRACAEESAAVRAELDRPAGVGVWLRTEPPLGRRAVVGAAVHTDLPGDETGGEQPLGRVEVEAKGQRSVGQGHLCCHGADCRVAPLGALGTAPAVASTRTVS
eukprot:CAMPEP_0185421574 /NCGR_PEP_ID=MMETSP1365-20130426/11108_1 /TAXON_ID=38817 /ORGANISM="Gephyrocapsa oceanica, Strain RCC1303" /LENGTH=425 /DNA_ID=CAMNT_0028025305 /DNA_START=22 /DNA_END=1300 /DNA_ORIENTATION=+